MAIKIRQSNGLTATMDSPNAPQDLSNPLIGPNLSTTGSNESPLFHIDMDNNWKSVYPVGSIYINATDSTNPSTLIGFGTWESFGKGRILVGHNESNDDSPAVVQSITGTEGPSNNLFSIIFKHTHEYAPGQRVTLSGISGMAGVNPNQEWTINRLGSLGGAANDKAITLETTGLTRDGTNAPTLTEAKARFAGTEFGGFNTSNGYSGNISHKLTINEMPKHQHQTIDYNEALSGLGRWTGYIDGTRATYTHYVTGGGLDRLAFQGEGEPHNNLQSYITAYIWRRTA